MPIDLNKKALDWENISKDEHEMLRDLQGNILKGHGRSHAEHIFLRFDPTAVGAVKEFLRGLASSITPALEQIKDATTLRQIPTDDPAARAISDKIFIGVALSSSGYIALGIGLDQTPDSPEFRLGMKARAQALGDPLVESWDEVFSQDLHAMVLLAGGSATAVAAAGQALRASIPAAVTVVGSERGLGMRNQNGDGIEHFGYVDGRSQPLFLKEDVAREPAGAWDPSFPLGQALVPSPGATRDTSHGSYFVFRKLEQDVHGFKQKEEELADALGLHGQDRSQAGAMVVGRFEDGTPVVMRSAEGLLPVTNDFNFNGDPQGHRCPFQSHIRKTNPRGESVGTFAASEAEERAHIMPRRGIPYGQRDADRLEDGRITGFRDRPRGGVGLLFMAYQSDISGQFEFTQRLWANNPEFVNADTGIDPVIGQGQGQPQAWPTTWGGDEAKSFNFSGFVTMRGGEYFFTPSISFFHSL